MPYVFGWSHNTGWWKSETVRMNDIQILCPCEVYVSKFIHSFKATKVRLEACADLILVFINVIFLSNIITLQSLISWYHTFFQTVSQPNTVYNLQFFYWKECLFNFGFMSHNFVLICPLTTLNWPYKTGFSVFLCNMWSTVTVCKFKGTTCCLWVLNIPANGLYSHKL